MKHYKGYGRDWVPATIAIIGLVLAAVAVGVGVLYYTGVDFR